MLRKIVLIVTLAMLLFHIPAIRAGDTPAGVPANPFFTDHDVQAALDASPDQNNHLAVESAYAGSDGNALLAIDYRNGKIVWRHEWPSGGGVTNNLSTAGNLLFTSNGSNLVAFDAANGKILWHSTLMAPPTAGPISYLLDGKQYILVAAGDSLYAFRVNDPAR